MIDLKVKITNGVNKMTQTIKCEISEEQYHDISLIMMSDSSRYKHVLNVKNSENEENNATEQTK